MNIYIYVCVCLYLIYIYIYIGEYIYIYVCVFVFNIYKGAINIVIYIRLAASRTLIGRPRPWASIYISVNVYIMSCESHNTYICISDYSL